MTARKPCPPAPGPLEDYAQRFDEDFASLAQRRGFRDYLAGLLLPRDRNKTLTGLAGTEPVRGAQHPEAQHPEAQRLQYFLSEADWDADAINARRLALLLRDPATAPHAGGVLVVDDSGDRKAGTQTAHVARQYLGSVGKIDNGIVAVSTLWADERIYYPLHVAPYTPARRLPKGKRDPAFHTKPQLAVELITAARAIDLPFRAVVADSFYGDHLGFEEALLTAELPFVVALKAAKGTWAPIDQAHTPAEAAQLLRWGGPAAPGDWNAVPRRFRDGHTEQWWAAEARLAGYGPEATVRLVVATTDPATLPPLTTWYLATNLRHPAADPIATAPFPPADLAEVVRLYGLRTWVEQGYKQVKDHLGWADFQVRADRAIRRHWTLVLCAFAVCWRAWFAARATAWPPPPPDEALPPQPVAADTPHTAATTTTVTDAVSPAGTARGEKERAAAWAPTPAPPTCPSRTALADLAGGAAPRAELARALDYALAHLARLVHSRPTTRAAGAA